MLTCDKVMMMGDVRYGKGMLCVGCCLWLFLLFFCSKQFLQKTCEFVMFLLIILVFLLIEEGKEFLFLNAEKQFVFPTQCTRVDILNFLVRFAYDKNLVRFRS